jgi:hypothetical protein
MLALEGDVSGSTIRAADKGIGHCNLEDAKLEISSLKRVLRVEANHITCMLFVEYDSRKVVLEQISKAIGRA